MKKYLPLLAAGIFAAALAFAGPIVTWSSGDTITANDLSANFTHIHATMVGGHGPRLVNSDINASAAISHSKLATPSLVPKVWGIVASCTTSPCTIQGDQGISSVTRTDGGVYLVTYDSARANTTYGALVTSTGASAFKTCSITSYGTTTAGVGCIEHKTDGGGPVWADDGFSFVLMDDNN